MRRNRWVVVTVDTDSEDRARLIILVRCPTQRAADLTFAEGGPCYGIVDAGIACIPRSGSLQTANWPKWIDVVLRRRFIGQKPQKVGEVFV